MTAKQILFHSEAREKLLRGATAARRRGARHPGPPLQVGAGGAQVGPAAGLRRRRHHRQGGRAQGPRGEHGRRRCCASRPSAPSTRSATAPPPPPCSRTPSSPRACATWWPARARWTLKRGIERGLRWRSRSSSAWPAPIASRRRRRRRSPPSPRTATPPVGELVADAIEKVGSEGVITVEEAKGTQTELEVVEGLRFDNGFLSAYFVTDPEKMECVLTDALVLLYDKKLSAMKPLLAAAGAGGAAGRAAADHRRGRGGRGAGHAGGEQGARRAALRGGEGARLRRPPQGDAGGPRGAHRRPRSSRRSWARRWRRRTARAPGPRASGWW